MRWYSGGIAEAISASKAKGAIFVVYIEGTDEQSIKITDQIDNGAFGESLDRDYFVAIKVEADSVSHQQFSEIFQVPSIPSVFFIGKTGVPLDIISGSDNLDNISKRIEDIISKAGITATKSASVASKNLIEIEKPKEAGDIVCENGLLFTRDVPTSSSTEEPCASAPVDSSETNSEELSQEDKIERAKVLLENKREQKLAEEKENERRKEVERRKMGQNVQQLKKWQQDQELKQLLEDRDKEKRENQLARETVLAQIAQDRAERQSKLQPSSPPVETPKYSTVQPSPRVHSNMTRLQFKLPDGSSHTQEFANADSLNLVVSYIKANLKFPFNDFKLSTTFPRREFLEDDYSQSLLSLQLCPNAVILVLPVKKSTISANPGGSFTALIWSLFAPIFSMFDYFKSFIFGRNRTTTGTKRPSEEPTDTKSTNPKRRIIRDSTVVKRQGNIHRLSDRNDSDDDGNTWNGNSTQQM